jgi:hypothetical protein
MNNKNITDASIEQILKEAHEAMDEKIKILKSLSNAKISYKIGMDKSFLYINEQTIKFNFIRDLRTYTNGMIKILKVNKGE